MTPSGRRGDTPPVDPTAERSDAATTWKRWLAGPSPRDRMLLYEEIASLVRAGIGIREALDDLASRAGGRRRRALLRVADAVRHSVPVGEAMLALPECFPPVEARLVAAGERTGRLDAAFRDASAEVARARAATRRFLLSLSYPVFLLHFAAFVPPAITALVAGQPVLRTFAWGFAAAGLAWGSVVALLTLHLSRRRRPGWGRMLLSLPLAGGAARSTAVARAARVSAALHDAGEDVASTLAFAGDACGNGWVASTLRTASERAGRGMSVAASLSCVDALEPHARSLIETGETSGSLAESFRRIADVEEERAARAWTRVAVTLGAIAFTAVVVIVVVMAMTTVGGYFAELRKLAR